MPQYRRLLIGVSNCINRYIGPRWGETFPVWYVSAFPKSGSTWLGRMVADYLAVPFPQFPIFPMGCECVIQNHWMYTPGLRRVFYLYRDGRDVIVSHYFFHMRRLQRNPKGRFERRVARGLDRGLGRGYDPEDVIRNLPRYIEEQMTNPPSRHVRSWPEHVTRWCDTSREHVAYLSYEQLRTDPMATLETALGKFLAQPVDEAQLSRSVERFDFQRVAGRKVGTEDRMAHARKGITGDWKNYFTKEAGEVFDKYCGQVLIDLGYEPDRSWLQTHQFVPSPD